MAKSVDAFRTISEVAEWLEVPPHVLRFWESKFSQVKPVKRAGGRRYYRPADMLLLGGIKVLLHDEGMTIKGVQKPLGEHGARHVSDRSPSLERITGDMAGGMLIDATLEPSVSAEMGSLERPDDTGDIAGKEDETDAFDADPGRADQGQRQARDLDDERSIAPAPSEIFAATDSLEPTGPADMPPEDPARELAHEPASDTGSAPNLPTLPDLPEDADDDIPAAPGPLAAIAALTHPVSHADAARLALLFNRLRVLGEATTSKMGDRD